MRIAGIEVRRYAYPLHPPPPPEATSTTAGAGGAGGVQSRFSATISARSRPTATSNSLTNPKDSALY